MNDLINIITHKVENTAEATWQLRCLLHQNPELSYKEFETQQLVINQLKKIGIVDIKKMANTGVVALIHGAEEGDCIALRADMDALPIHETNEVEYKSKNDGIMHACGHDFHTANLLGVAQILFELKSKFKGTFKLIFQPGEEKNPGGASIMIAEGILENPQVKQALALHVFPALQAGQVGFYKGLYMASCDEVYVTITGKGGHAATPQLINNPIYPMSELILSTQKINEEATSNNIEHVLTFGKIEANGATNIVPQTIKIHGTFRSKNETWRASVHQKLNDLADTIAKKHSVSIDMKIAIGYPCLVNDIALTTQIEKYTKELLGEACIQTLEKRMTSEDFAFFSQKIPVCYYRIGTASANGGNAHNVHTSDFDIEKSAMKIALKSMSYAAIQLINT